MFIIVVCVEKFDDFFVEVVFKGKFVCRYMVDILVSYFFLLFS